jgi:GNAT superfamily N-acetyltransferase
VIETIKPNHNIDEYYKCIEDLMSEGVQKATIREFGSKVAFMPQNYEVYVMVLDGKIVATASIMYEFKLRYSKPKAYIEDVAVNRAHRGKGFGKQMIEHCVGVAKSKNCYKIVLSCKDDLVGFYENLGFEKDQNFMVKK